MDVISVDRALKRLEEFDPDQARIVELRFFAGMTVEETADVVEGHRPVKREWAVAKAWLYKTSPPDAANQRNESGSPPRSVRRGNLVLLTRLPQEGSGPECLVASGLDDVQTPAAVLFACIRRGSHSRSVSLDISRKIGSRRHSPTRTPLPSNTLLVRGFR